MRASQEIEGAHDRIPDVNKYQLATREHRERMVEICYVWKLIQHLMVPEDGLCLVDRDNFSCALDVSCSSEAKESIWRLVSELMIEDENSLSFVRRDNFAAVMGYLIEEFEAAQEALDKILFEGIPDS